MRYLLRHPRAGCLYEVKHGGNCPMSEFHPHRLLLSTPQADDPRIKCISCGADFILEERLTPIKVLERLVEQSIQNLPGRELEEFRLGFQTSLSDDDKAELVDVLPDLKEVVFSLVEKGRISLLGYRMSTFNPTTVNLLFPGDVEFSLESPSISFSMRTLNR